MNKKYIIRIAFFIFIAASFSFLFAQDETVRFAVSPFVSLTEDAEKENAGPAASSQIEKMMGTKKWYELRHSGEIESFFEKLEYAQAGGGNEEEVAALGKTLMIQYLTVGSVSKIDSYYEIDSRSVDINTWNIVHSAGCSSADLDLGCGFINKEMDITLTKEDVDKRIAKLKDSPTMAVYRFNDSNDLAQDAGYAGVFAEVLNSELGARPDLAVMERTHLKAVIDAKQLEMCGIDPNDDSGNYFAVRGITYKFEGDIRVFPDVISIGYKVRNSADGRQIYMGYSEIGSSRGMRFLARKISQDVDDSINNRIGTVTIKTVPAGASVFVDNALTGKSPVIVSLTAGTHPVRIAMSGYQTVSKDITTQASKVTEETITMQTVSLALFVDAFNLERSKKWEDAVSRYDEFIKTYNDTEEANQAYYRKGHIQLLYLNDRDSAIKTFEELIARYPDSMTRAEAYFGMARAYKGMGQNDMLAQTLAILRDKFPNEIATEEARAEFGM